MWKKIITKSSSSSKQFWKGTNLQSTWMRKQAYIFFLGENLLKEGAEIGEEHLVLVKEQLSHGSYCKLIKWCLPKGFPECMLGVKNKWIVIIVYGYIFFLDSSSLVHLGTDDFFQAGDQSLCCISCFQVCILYKVFHTYTWTRNNVSFKTAYCAGMSVSELRFIAFP